MQKISKRTDRAQRIQTQHEMPGRLYAGKLKIAGRKPRNKRKVVKVMTNERQETYEQLIAMGYSPEEAWEVIAAMDFAEDYDE